MAGVPRRPRDGPRALLVAGPAGSGKSTLGAELARQLPASLLDQDVLTNPLVAVVQRLLGVGENLDDARLRELVRGPRYDVLLDAAGDQLRCGVHAVLVAPFTAEAAHEDRWEQVSRRLLTAGATEVHLVWLDVAPLELRRRLRARGAARDRARTEDPEALRSWLDDLRPPAVAAVRVTADDPVDAQARTVLAAILSSS